MNSCCARPGTEAQQSAYPGGSEVIGAFATGPVRIWRGESVCFNFGFPHTEPITRDRQGAPTRASLPLTLASCQLPACLTP